jgi:hypothetical protein
VKIHPAHLDELRSRVTPLDTEENRAKYRAGDFPRADSVKDLDKRYRWDLLWAAVSFDWVNHYLYGYLDDNHIDTALKAIVPPLGKEKQQ